MRYNYCFYYDTTNPDYSLLKYISRKQEGVDTGAFRCDSDGFFVNNSLAAGDRHTSAFTSLLMGIPWKLEQSLHLQNKRPMCIGCPLCCILFDLFRSAMKRQPAGGFFDQ